jgi:hypothetical protein
MIFYFITALIIFYSIAEFIGRRKQIGFWWSFILLFGGFINGIIAITLSPSAKKEQVKGTRLLLILGLISIIIIGIIPLVISIIDLNDYNPIIDNKASTLTLTIKLGISVSFIISGFYMTLLSIGKIVNKNPKFYFENILTILKHKMYSILNKNLKYYINENENQSICLSFQELKDKQINENTLIWRKGLKKWTPASKLNEIHTIINFSPPPINENEYTIPEKNITELKEFKKNKILIIPFITFILLISVALNSNYYIHNWVLDVTNLYPNYHKMIAIKKEYVNAKDNLFSSAFDSKRGLLYIVLGDENTVKYFSVMDKIIAGKINDLNYSELNLLMDIQDNFDKYYSVMHKIKRIAGGSNEKLTEQEGKLYGTLGTKLGLEHAYDPITPQLAQSMLESFALGVYGKAKKIIPYQQGSLEDYVKQILVIDGMMKKFDQALSQNKQLEKNYEALAKAILDNGGNIKETYEGKVKVIGYTSRNYPIFDFNSSIIKSNK